MATLAQQDVCDLSGASCLVVVAGCDPGAATCSNAIALFGSAEDTLPECPPAANCGNQVATHDFTETPNLVPGIPLIDGYVTDRYGNGAGYKFFDKFDFAIDGSIEGYGGLVGLVCELKAKAE